MLISYRFTRSVRRVVSGGLFALVAACAGADVTPEPQARVLDEVFPIFTASDALEEKWRKAQIWSVSEWRLSVVDDVVAIEPRVDRSSTLLGRWIEFDTRICPEVEWTWRVEAHPETVDLASREAEDLAASIMFIFGDPGSLLNPNPVPTLRYVWSNEAHQPGDVIRSPYFPNVIRNLVVRSGEPGPRWATERRDLRADYAKAFGAEPEDAVQAFALFSDNDHNGETVTAFYLDAKAWCSEAPDEGFIFD